MTYHKVTNAHGYSFGTKSEHRISKCNWCAQALEVGLGHMKDATLKTTKSTKYEPNDTAHVVQLVRLGRDNTPRFADPSLTVRTTMKVDPCDLSDDTLHRVFSTTESNWDRAMIEEVMNLRIKLSRKRPVVLDLEEHEAALLLDLLHAEVDGQTALADSHYQNGSGFERECAEAREAERKAEAVADRLRKLLRKYLDKAYHGELES